MTFSTERPERSVGLYLHVPFCTRVCPYCDFAVVAARPLDEAREDRYVDALLHEFEMRAPDYEGHGLASIYLGGGTPSLMRPASIERLLAAARSRFAERPGAGGEIEVTLEVNPSSVERARLPAFRRAGVNRLSVGIQSFDDTSLRRLGRAHKAVEGRRTLTACREAGFTNLSLDLLFAGPGASLARLDGDLREVADFGPEHVSAYELTLEAGTPFARAAALGQLDLPEEEAVVSMMEMLQTRLGEAGLARYELSNYARPGYEAVHNRRYWERKPVLGLGVGAWSTLPAGPGVPHGRRRANVRELQTYLARVEAGGSPEVESEILEPRVARGEAMFLGLRCTSGVRAALFTAEFSGPPRDFFAQAIDELTERGLVTENDRGDIQLTAEGRLLSDSVFEHFV